MPEMIRLEQAAVRAYSYGRFRELLEAAQNVKGIIVLLLQVIFQGHDSLLFKKIERAILNADVGILNLGKETRITKENYKECVTLILNKIVSKGGYCILKGTFADVLMRVLEMHFECSLGWYNSKGFQVVEPRSSSKKLKIVAIQWPPIPGRNAQHELTSDSQLIFEDREELESGAHRWHYIQVSGERLMFCGRAFSNYAPLSAETLSKCLQPYKVA